jgi:hypothetical protein
MAKATVKSGSGAVITIEGTSAEVAEMLATFERSATVGRAKGVVARQQASKKAAKKRSTAGELVMSLHEHGFFDEPKSLSQISDALEEQGHLYPVTTLSGVMLGLVKKKDLRRKKIDGRWAYGK